MTVVREYAISELSLKDQFNTAPESAAASQSLPSNMLLQGATLRTSTTFGRAATVKAGEDIRPALESLRSAGGGTLILLAGIHHFTYNIVGSSKINIIGEGRDQTILDFGGGAYGVQYVGTVGARLASFTLAGFTVQNSNNGGGIDINYADFFEVKDVKSTSNDQAGLRIQNVTNFFISCISSLNTGNGISFTSVTKGDINNSNISDNTGKGIEFISGNSNVRVNGNTLEANGSDGIKLTATSDQITIIASTVSGSGGYGVNIAAATCDDNYIVAPTLITNTSGDINDLGTNTTIINDTIFVRTSEFVASETIALGKAVGLNIDGEIARAFRGRSNTVTNAPAITSVVDIVALTTNTYVALLQSGSVDYDTVVFTIDANSHAITFGTQLNIIGFARGGGVGICKISATKFGVAWAAQSDDDAYFTVCSVSGTTITKQTDTRLAIGTFTGGKCCYLADDRIAFMYYRSGFANVAHGFCTISTYTPTVVASLTTGIANITGTMGGGTTYLAMKKVATDKFVMIQPDTGYGVVCTTVSTTYTVGTAVLIGLSATSSHATIVSAASDTFYTRYLNFLAYCTVSGTVITVVDTESPTEDTTASIIEDGSTIYEICDSSNAVKDGLYKITGTTTLVRTLVSPFTNTGGYGANDGTTFMFLASSLFYHIRGMTSNYVGFCEAAIANNALGKVASVGTISGQTGLIPGAAYEIVDGGLTLTGDLTKKYLVIAKSATEIML